VGVVNKSELLVGVVNKTMGVISVCGQQDWDWLVCVVNKTMGVISGCGQQDYGSD